MSAHNKPVQATYYSIARVDGAVVLLARWTVDDVGGASYFIQIDAIKIDENADSVEVVLGKYKELTDRNKHLLRMEAAA